MHRLFVAIDPPAGIKADLMAMMGGITGARWQSEAQLHLTVRFIGEVETKTANAVAEVLSSIRHRGFAIALAGVGTFERKGRVDTLWVGVEPHEPLKALHNKVDRALDRIGIAPDTRAYLPHITIARFSRGAGPLGGFLETSRTRHAEPFTVDAFCLYESRLTEAGADYRIVERFALAA